MRYNADQFFVHYYVSDDNGCTALTPLQESEIRAQSRSILYHYTSFETLQYILNNQTLKFNRIDYVNDRMESNTFGEDDLAHMIFVSCFSIDDIESIPMWKIYGKDRSGLRIGFELSKPNFVENFLDKEGNTTTQPSFPLYRSGKLNSPCADWQYTIKAKDVVYDISVLNQYPIRRKYERQEIFDLTAMGAVKRKEWEYEHECRLIAELQTSRNGVEIPNLDCLFVPIKFDKVSRLKITFNPWMNQETKDSVKQFISTVSALDPSIICYENSVLDGEIREL